MTDKRFTIDYSDESIINTFTKQYYPTDDINGVEDICDLLNELYEKNEQLKHRFAISEKANFVTALEKENERLKACVEEVVDLLNTLSDENEQLKKDLLEVHEICAYYEGRIKELQGDVE